MVCNGLHLAEEYNDWVPLRGWETGWGSSVWFFLASTLCAFIEISQSLHVSTVYTGFWTLKEEAINSCSKRLFCIH